MRCPLPGCANETPDGAPCDECRGAFGSALRPATQPTRRPMTDAELDARDQAMRDAYATRRRKLHHPVEQERRANQLCWMCDQRRTCTLVLGRWECTDCQGVR
jgi:hypothetical protein